MVAERRSAALEVFVQCGRIDILCIVVFYSVTRKGRHGGNEEHAYDIDNSG